MNSMSDEIPRDPIKFGLFVAKPHKKWVVLAFTCVLIATGLGRAMVLVLQSLTDSLIKAPLDFSVVWFWALLWPVMFAIESMTWRLSGFTGMKWFVGAFATAYESLYDYMSLHSKDYFNSRFAGSLTNKISNAVGGQEYLFSKLLWKFVPLFGSIFWYVIIAGMKSPLLGAIIAVWSTFFILINTWFAKKMQPYSVRYAEAQSNLKGRLVDSLSNISLVQENAYLHGEQKYIRKFIKQQYDTAKKRWWLGEWVLVINEVFIFIFMFFLIVTSVHLFQLGKVSLGVIVMAIAIMSDLSGQLFFLGSELRDAAGEYGQAKEGLDEILQGHVIVDAPNAHALEVDKGAISFNSVDFEYENSPVFQDFSLTIPAGQKIGLVGRSGAGKTTFVSLLLRHFDVQGGEVSIDGQNIQLVTLQSLRKAIAFVPQDTSLFHRTILENIRYSNPEASLVDVEKAAKRAQAHEFIKSLPKGYETLVGERGVKLSGGQRQRVAIARAFLKNAPILVFDEATSSLDSESEQAIQEALERLIQGRTVIAIAHRLSTLKKMDRIIIIDNGRVVEDGSPEELLVKGDGIFKEMWERQVKGFILDEEFS